MIAPTCPHCGKPVDQGRHVKIGSGGGQDEYGSRYVEMRWRCDEVLCSECGAPAYYRATQPHSDRFFCTHACANEHALRKTFRFSLKTLAGAMAVLALLLLSGCASLTHEPGTPSGGPYCIQRGGDPEPACYPTEAARSEAWHRREAEARQAWTAEHPKESRAIAAEQAQARDDFEARQRRQREESDADAAARATVEEERTAERAADAEARQAEAIRIDLARQRTADPAYAVPALSALLCREQARETEFRDDLQRQARIQAISGVVAKRERSSLAAGLVDAQDRAYRLRTRLRTIGGGSSLPCASVAPLLACRAGDEFACRSEPSARDKVDVLREFEREQ